MAKQSLRLFLPDLRKASRIEAVAVLALYAREHEGKPEINESIVRSLWPRAGGRLPAPGNVAQALRDAKNNCLYGYLERGSGHGWFRLTPEGAEHAEELLQRSDSQVKEDVEVPLHPVIAEHVADYLATGNTGVAVLEAFKAVNNFVKKKCGHPCEGNRELDGKDLMGKAFRPEAGFLCLNQAKNQTDKDEQEGFMHLFMGAIQGIRNPRSHEKARNMPLKEATEYLCFASLLLRQAERAKIRVGPAPR
jgi:uncharacterized protein (TIGR02391 family)